MYLNVAAGKIGAIMEETPKKYCIINLDPMYLTGLSAKETEYQALYWHNHDSHNNPRKQILCKAPANEFLERTILTFDKIFIYRYLEHVSFTEVLYFIYLLSMVTKPGATVDVIVPNYQVLAQMLMLENVYDYDFEQKNILLTTELLNEPSCPHASIWTPDRAVYFWEFENRFKVDPKNIETEFVFDGRDIYFRFQAERI
jgi:hypothetical protein